MKSSTMSGCENKLKYKIIGHTADIGITAYGKDLPELFINVALGMMKISVEVFKCLSVEGEESKEVISITAVDREHLLVKWLQELLFLFNSKRLVPRKFKINFISEKSLSAGVCAVPFDTKKFEVRHEIKAVTHHNLSIKKVSGQFNVTVIFDI